ncbi:mechanosensitive ion channel [Actinotalea sp. BY-33]|uniref:Mechanosensitive ion channel n=1 Tax=Actinotalea soli TaxID=2819234 RepID=A0A939RXF5_9CELL|nr:mechanosensitive ion channel [Actinotalea soli]
MVVVAVAAALVVALVLAEVIAAVVRAAGRRTWLAENLSRRARQPLRAVLVVSASWVAIRLVTRLPTETDPGAAWRPAVEHALLIALIASLAWLVGALAFVAEDAALARYRTDVADNRHARRVRTQVSILRRLTVAALVLCAIAASLLTFEGARVAGAGLLASAGVLSVVAGLAAQSSLANLFAGLQLAFTDAIRVDDVVVVEGEWGRIEEITLTYVVVHLWDDRRLILPSTWFTSTPFQNWTRRAADLLGTVELDLDWTVPVDEMRIELTRLLEASGLWDHRVGILQVTEATGGLVRVRALASAADAPTLFDLRCYVREGLVVWLQGNHLGALPRTRLEDGAVARPRVVRSTDADPADADPADADPSGADLSDADSAEPEVESVPTSEPAPGPAPGVVPPASPASTPARPTPAPDPGASPAPPAGRQDADPRQETQVMAAVDPPRRRRTAELQRELGSQQDTVRLDLDKHSRLFTGSLAAVERSKAFSGPGQEVMEEREHTAEQPVVPPTDEDEAQR